VELHRAYGSLPLEDLIDPALNLAQSGFPIDSMLADDLKVHFAELAQFESTRRIFLKNGASPEAGEILIQTELAQTLQAIREFGRAGFYSGRTAHLLESSSLAHGGLITKTDLREYQAIWRPPISCDYQGWRIFAMGPPSSGGILLAEIFNMASQFKLPGENIFHPAFVHLFAEICRRAYADRAEYLGDADQVEIPLQELLSQEYARDRIADFNVLQATPSEQVGPGLLKKETGSTTHFSIIDRYGNAVALTYTLNSPFGAKVVADSLGFFLNNEMDDFAILPGHPNLYGLTGGTANGIAAQTRPLSSMSPTLVFRDDSLLMVTGASGGSRIITAVALSLFSYFVFNEDLQTAIGNPRYHHQHLPDLIIYEAGAFSAETAARLIEIGHLLQECQPYGNINALARKSPDRRWEAAGDGRRAGKAKAIY